MLNARRVDAKFWLSGGWQHLDNDTKNVKKTGIMAVLDLQFTPADSPEPTRAIESALSALGVEYHYIPMWDGPLGQNLADIFQESNTLLADFELRFPGPKEQLLVKCAAGQSRSVSVLVSHFCESRRWTYHEALNYIKKRDGYSPLTSDPNPVFATFLKRKYGS
jgi:protein tyrosine phosphatase (PTP) superfamily phosphohydrolase (DUF442 family)